MATTLKNMGQAILGARCLYHLEVAENDPDLSPIQSPDPLTFQ